MVLPATVDGTLQILSLLLIGQTLYIYYKGNVVKAKPEPAKQSGG